jgi:DNA-binding transcriptional regulator YdaS (Cro superfamily)
MRRLSLLVSLLFSVVCPAQQPSASEPNAAAKTTFHIRYINGNNVYIDGGRDAGLAEGMMLIVKQSTTQAQSVTPDPALGSGIAAQLRVVAVASTSAVCEVTHTIRALATGDTVSLREKEVEQMAETRAIGSTRQYPMIVSFTEGDPLDEEVREELPRPPLPEVNEARGRIGFDVSSIRSLSPGSTASTVYGAVARADISRIWGTHWNLNGYWRGQFRSGQTPSQPSIQDLINRTYQMSLTYLNPDSKWTAGVGRLYLPWASSLEVIDGGYLARLWSANTITGVFAGSTPDPTAWNYNPDRRIGGMFFNAHGGSYDSFRYSSTAGAGIDLIKWNIDRPFVFTENDFSWKNDLSVYHAMQIDKPTPNPSTPAVSAGLGQSFLSVQVHVLSRATLELNDTYFRDIPTYDSELVGTGLLDQYLFQGLTGGARIDFPMHITGYFSVGQSSTSADTGKSWNMQGGVTMSHIRNTGLQVDARYAQFNSNFATGSYRTLTLSRTLADRFQLNVQGGLQAFSSSLTTNTAGWFANAYCDTNLGSRFFIETGYTTQRGGTDDYDQWTTTLGLRFDNRAAMRRALHAHKH